jgi:hypothetical protein
VALAFAVGLPLLNAVISTPDEVPAGTVGNVGLGVDITPVAGWSTPPDTITNVRTFTLGGVILQIRAQAFSGPTRQAYDLASHAIDELDGYRLTGDAATYTTRSGLVGIGNYFASASTTGYLAVFTANGVLAWVRAEGPLQAWNSAIDDISSMVASIEIEARR